ncbi:GNAT family N-acetyltransferase [Chamaesiphon sp. OTE_8_metabat_110]|uniref:lipid II:glycine glycyltransferase FemX n=1 Tax=Chamaesiphon sp. OTE_8_metabat_110 TaxID=2964696 RepID=UPI00286AD0DE|nr:GNAT family N-acetyltransferase [Chamaesiphon sp. OTE_8_metabat_110]
MTGAIALPNLNKVRVVLPTNPDWQKYLNNLPHDFYHLAGYLELEAQRYEATAEAIVIEDDAEVFFLPYLLRNCDCPGAPVYDVISPYGYPGMLVSPAGQNPQFIDRCLQTIYRYWQERNICSAFLRLHPILNSYFIDRTSNDRHESNRSIEVTERLHHRGDVVICDLTNDLEDIWKQIRSSHRTKINKLKRSGLMVRMVPVDRYLEVFIEIYRETMNRVNATSSYYFTQDYFERFVKALGNGVQLCVVEVDGQIIAASLITEFSGIVQYHLGGTRTEFLPYSPTTLVFDYVIKWAKQRQNRYFNLGGGLNGQDSLYHFKIGFSDLTKSFATLETIVDCQLYDRLTAQRAESLGLTTSALNNTSFFPAYRAN